MGPAGQHALPEKRRKHPGSICAPAFFVDADPPTYRPNVAAILVDPAGRILVGERIGMENSWQFPQGGLNLGESPQEALPRELHEELSLEAGDYTVESKRGPYRYLFAPGRTKEGFQGQEQHYFRLRLLASASKVNVRTPHPEFRAVRWIAPADFRLAWLPEMKREVYRQVFRDFFGLEIC